MDEKKRTKDRGAKKLTFHPATGERWEDLVRLFGKRGACGGCWCMAWRLGHKEWHAGKGTRNKRRLGRLVKSGKHAPGVLAYAGKEAVGWCAIAPREEYPALGRSRALAPVDERAVWSVSCFFVVKGWRNKGVSAELLKAAARFAKGCGARLVEGYPQTPWKGRMPDVFAWTGLEGAFKRAGFREVARRSKTRPMMRREL